MLLRHFLLATLSAPSLLVAAVPLGPVRPATSPSPVVAAGVQREAQVATSGRETLVAWRDNTPGRDGVYLAALASDGTLAPGTQRQLAPGATRVRLTWNGQSYLALWAESSGGGITAMTLDGERRTLTPARRVTSDGLPHSNVAWIGGRGALMIGRTLLLVDRDGREAGRFDDVQPGRPFYSGRVGTDGESFFVFWEATNVPETTILVRRFTPEGQPRDPAALVAAQSRVITDDWDIAFGGNRFALAFAEQEPGEPRMMHRILIDPDTLQAAPLAPVSIGFSSGPRLAWTGDRFAALWLQNQEEAASSRIGTSAVLDQGTFTIRTLSFTTVSDSAATASPFRSGAGFNPAVVWNGTNFIVAFTVRQFLTPGSDIHSAAVPLNTHSVVSLAPQWQEQPAVAANGREALVVWTEGSPHSDLLSVAAAHATAGVVDTDPVYLSRGAVGKPEVVYTGSLYMVLWLEPSGGLVPLIMMQRVSPSGNVLDPEPVLLGAGFGISAASNGTHTLIVVVDYFGTIRATRFTPDGRLLDATPIELTPGGLAGPPLIASNGSDFLLVWPQGSDGHFPIPDLIDLWAARVTAGGALAGTFPVATGPANQRDFSVASDGRDYLIAYVEDGRRVVTKKVLREGALAGTTADAPGTPAGAPDNQAFLRAIHTAIAFTGNGYALAWEEGNSSLAATARLAGIDRDGIVTDAAITLADSELYGMAPAIATAAGRGTLAYAVYQHDPAYGGTMRLFLRTIGETRPRGRAVRH